MGGWLTCLVVCVQVMSSYFRFGCRMVLSSAKEAGEDVPPGRKRDSLRDMAQRHAKRIAGNMATSGFGTAKSAWWVRHKGQAGRQTRGVKRVVKRGGWRGAYGCC